MSVSGNSESIDIQSGDCAILMMLINNMQRLTQEILRLCREYGECRVEAERMEEARRGEKCPGECVCDGEAETGYFGSGIAFGVAGCL